MHGQKLHADAALFNSLEPGRSHKGLCIWRQVTNGHKLLSHKMQINRDLMTVFPDLYFTEFTNELYNFLFH